MNVVSLMHRPAKVLMVAVGVGLSIALSGCEAVVVDEYEAIAVTTYTWRAEYLPRGVTPDRPREGRTESFESNSLVNMNGQPTVVPTGDRDSQGIWWPALPPKPTVDELEARLKDDETFSEPQIHKSVEYTLTFEKEGDTVTLPTQYPVYREAVRAYENGRSLELILSPQDIFVQKAEMQ